MSTIAELLYRVRVLEREQDGHVYFDESLGKLQYIRGGKPQDFDLSDLRLASLSDVDVETVPPVHGQILGYFVPGGLADPYWKPVDQLTPNYTFNQTPAATEWQITHNLGYRPAGVTIIDLSGSTLAGRINFVDTNTMTVTFTSPREGTAYLS